MMKTSVCTGTLKRMSDRLEKTRIPSEEASVDQSRAVAGRRESCKISKRLGALHPASSRSIMLHHGDRDADDAYAAAVMLHS